MYGIEELVDILLTRNGRRNRRFIRFVAAQGQPGDEEGLLFLLQV